MVFLVLFILPIIVIAIGAAITKEIDWREFFAMTATQATVAGLSALVVSYENTSAVEILNGQVTSKQMNEVSCSHSYQCNCYESCSTDSKGTPSCTTTCQTCWEHSNDYDWDVYTNIGKTITIDRIDRQGVDKPPRWDSVQIGEPISVSHNYENYIKAAPDSLFRNQGVLEKYKTHIPVYPNNIYDYYRLNRLVEVGTNVAQKHKWNDALSELNKKLGPRKEANVIVVFTTQPHEYFYALRQAWIGGNKNDIVAVVGLKYNSQPDWVEIMAWSQNKTIDVKLRDDIMGLANITPETLVPVLESNIAQFYSRKPMHDFEYLASTITPTTNQWYITLIIGILVAIAQVVFYSQKHMTFDPVKRYNSK